MAEEATLPAMVLEFLKRARRMDGGLDGNPCDVLVAMLETAQTESRITAKSVQVLTNVCLEAKEALLRSRSPEGDEDARLLRLRVMGSLDDVMRGAADTDGLRLRWRAQVLAEVTKLPPAGRERRAVLKFERKEQE